MKFCQRLHYLTRGGHTRAIWLVYKIERGMKWLDPIKVIEEDCNGRPSETANMANLPSQLTTAKDVNEWVRVAKGRGILA